MITRLGFGRPAEDCGVVEDGCIASWLTVDSAGLQNRGSDENLRAELAVADRETLC